MEPPYPSEKPIGRFPLSVWWAIFAHLDTQGREKLEKVENPIVKKLWRAFQQETEHPCWKWYVGHLSVGQLCDMMRAKRVPLELAHRKNGQLVRMIRSASPPKTKPSLMQYGLICTGLAACGCPACIGAGGMGIQSLSVPTCWQFCLTCLMSTNGCTIATACCCVGAHYTWHRCCHKPRPRPSAEELISSQQVLTTDDVKIWYRAHFIDRPTAEQILFYIPLLEESAAPDKLRTELLGHIKILRTQPLKMK